MLSPLSARMRVAGGRDYPRNWVGGVPHLVSPHSKPAASGPRVRPEIRWLLAPPAEPSVGAPGDTPPYLISRVITRQARRGLRSFEPEFTGYPPRPIPDRLL